ncbi:MAG: hypothetical protein ACLFQK_11915 [Fibrobacterota bacterium]
MASAIELYRKAYNTDYRNGDWETAEEIYNRIIEQFPHSEESEYAKVHLDRITKLKGNPEDSDLKPVNRGGDGGSVLGILGFILALLEAFAIVAAVFFILNQRTEIKYNRHLAQGLTSMVSGDRIDAELNFKIARAVLPSEKAADRALAELYIKYGSEKKAASIIAGLKAAGYSPMAVQNMRKRLEKRTAEAEKSDREE